MTDLELVSENRKDCEIYRILQTAHPDSRYIGYGHHHSVADDQASPDWLAIRFCLERAFIRFITREGPQYPGDTDTQVISIYKVTSAGEQFLIRNRS